MFQKKLSGQTIVIVILTILLLLTLCFGGVFAYYTYSSRKITGEIIMASLSIDLETSNTTDKSVISISNKGQVVPGEKLKNSALNLKNSSSVGVYIAIVYELKAVKKGGVEVEDLFEEPVLGLGFDYVNPYKEGKSEILSNNEDDWVDYVYYAEKEDKFYRCMIHIKGLPPAEKKTQEITIIEENELSLSKRMGNRYMSTTISFVMQAYAIGTASFMDINSDTTVEDKCDIIMDSIYENEGYEFFNVAIK